MSDSNGSNSSHSGEGACTLTAEAIAELVGGELRGDPGTAIAGVAPLDRAERHHVSIFAQARYASLYESCGAGIVLVETGLADFPTLAPSRVVVARPHDALLTLLPRLYPDRPAEPGIHPAARIGQRVQLGHAVALDAYCVIGDDAVIGDGVWIGSSSTVGERVSIGSGARIFPNVTIYSGSRLGERAIIHSGARIGSDGFGYVFRDGRHVKIPHVGRCIIGSDVEIGANTTIDRGSIDDTVIGDGTKIDNLVQVGHNVRIGRLCTIMAQVGIAGSAHIEDGCVIAGQAGIGGHLTIGAGARIAGQAGVFGDVPAGESWSGYPARPHAQSLRAQSALFRISSIIRKLEQLIDEKAGP